MEEVNVCGNKKCSTCNYYLTQDDYKTTVLITTGESEITHIDLVKKMKSVNKTQEEQLKKAISVYKNLKLHIKECEKYVSGLYNDCLDEFKELEKFEKLYPECKHEYEDDYPITDTNYYGELEDLLEKIQELDRLI